MESYDRVDSEERREATIESVPEETIQRALDIAVRYAACPYCEEKQFINVVPGHNSTDECTACGEPFKVIG